MTLEMAIIAAVRLAGSLPVLRWPFYGGVLAVLVDLSDLFMMNLIDLGGVRNYQAFDKYLDQAYMLAFLAVALGWQAWQRNVSIALFAYRFAGFVAFEATGARPVLLLFPNFFEAWFVGVAAVQRFRLERLNKRVLACGGAALIVLKLAQEYAIHYERWLDHVTAVEVVRDAWRIATGPF